MLQRGLAGVSLMATQCMLQRGLAGVSLMATQCMLQRELAGVNLMATQCMHRQSNPGARNTLNYWVAKATLYLYISIYAFSKCNLHVLYKPVAAQIHYRMSIVTIAQVCYEYHYFFFGGGGGGGGGRHFGGQIFE